MKSYLYSAIVALAACGISAAPSFAGAFGLFTCKHCNDCCFCVRPYNAFSPVCWGTITMPPCGPRGCGHGGDDDITLNYHGVPTGPLAGLAGDVATTDGYMEGGQQTGDVSQVSPDVAAAQAYQRMYQWQAMQNYRAQQAVAYNQEIQRAGYQPLQPGFNNGYGFGYGTSYNYGYPGYGYGWGYGPMIQQGHGSGYGHGYGYGQGGGYGYGYPAGYYNPQPGWNSYGR